MRLIKRKRFSLAVQPPGHKVLGLRLLPARRTGRALFLSSTFPISVIAPHPLYSVPHTFPFTLRHHSFRLQEVTPHISLILIWKRAASTYWAFLRLIADANNVEQQNATYECRIQPSFPFTLALPARTLPSPPFRPSLPTQSLHLPTLSPYLHATPFPLANELPSPPMTLSALLGSYSHHRLLCLRSYT